LDLEEQRSVRLNNDIWKNSEQQKSLKEQIEMFTKQQCSVKDEQSKVNQQIAEFTTLLGNIIVPSVTTEDIDVSLSTLNSAKSQLVTKRNQLQEEREKKIQELRTKQNLFQTKLRDILQEQNRIDKEKTKLETEKRLKLESISNHEAIISSLKENKCVYCGTILKKDELEKHILNEKAAIALINVSILDNTSDLDKQLEKLYDQEAQSQELIEEINKQILDI
jgi:DNA repair exonuclease SbcCD ATPase subunit